jgi:uncharacterized membrane protein YeaQ/YmgE (transglycosylase-associated protein family)
MYLLWALLLGLGVGAVTRLALPGKQPGSFLITAAVGGAGALLSSATCRAAGCATPGSGDSMAATILGALLLVLGAVVSLVAYRMLLERRIS